MFLYWTFLFVRYEIRFTINAASCDFVPRLPVDRAIDPSMAYRSFAVSGTGSCFSSQKACRPGPLKVEASDAAVAVQNFAGEIQARREL